MDADERRSLEACLEALRREIRLVEAQIARSRAYRGVAVTATAESSKKVPVEVEELSTIMSAAERSHMPTVSPPPVKPEERFASALPTVKAGYLWHVMGPNDADLQWHYFVVNAEGVKWYESKARYEQGSGRPLGSVGFSLTTTNSRGSVFRRAAVCWPLILPEDYPAVATDSSKTYFAIDYYVQPRLVDSIFGGGGGDSGGVVSRKLVVATAGSSERDEWICFLRQYIDVYLAPRAESEELQYLVAPPRAPSVDLNGSSSTTPYRRPLHRSEVIDGEAPGGNYL